MYFATLVWPTRRADTIAKSALAEMVFGFDDEANPNAIEIYVHRVRKKLEGSDVSIATLRGLCYVLQRRNGGSSLRLQLPRWSVAGSRNSPAR
jgi:hypothetical protein